MRRWDHYRFFEPSVPRRAKGGIRAQSKRGTFGESWWAKRWISVLESFDIGARLGRGRNYARSGQVLSIDIEKGIVKARVQGSKPTPYRITIGIKSITPANWGKLVKILSHQAIFVAKLLVGEMPQDIEKVFQTAGLSLFPEKSKDLGTECSCPDWSNPCKHIAAVYYLLGEEFDRDPFLIFKLRGLPREDLIKMLGSGEKETGKGKGKRKPPPARGEEKKALLPRPEPLPADGSFFWNGGALPEDFFGEVQIPQVSAVLLKRLGNFPFWRGKERFFDALEPTYAWASTRGLAVFLGEKNGPEDPLK
jgi:uncharacterized Zn finger protein